MENECFFPVEKEIALRVEIITNEYVKSVSYISFKIGYIVLGLIDLHILSYNIIVRKGTQPSI